jgi:phenylalanyl-tRNA synthetase beta chain
MKISFNWLCDYIDLTDFRNNIPELSRKLTQAGLEVEGIEDQKNAFQHVVIGHLLEVGKHPDADKLTVCKVNTGEPEPRQIVCGATNHKQGDYVIAALPGAVLPGDFAIKKSKIRGVESLGMLCSEAELGLAKTNDGIITMKTGEPGTPFAQVFGKNDIILEINVTPNRADCLSHRGLAYELSALLDRPLLQKDTKFELPVNTKDNEVRVTLEASALCPRYVGARINNIKVGPSPDWLVQRLENVGLRSINNIVDITNYIMFDYGQPMHAFDFDVLAGGEVIVRTAHDGETFTSLDEKEYKLEHQELVIADKNGVVALAGVIGGLNSGVSDSTKNIFLESAFFSAQGVRRTARTFGIETDSAYRFSRGVNPEHPALALQSAVKLILETAGGEFVGAAKDVYPMPIQREPIFVSLQNVEERLGYSIDKNDFQSVLQRLGCIFDGDKILVPHHRWDLNIAEDLIEEYGRIHGYEKILERLPILDSEPTNHDKTYINTRRVSDVLSKQGLSQVVNYAFVNKKLQETALGNVSADEIAVQNPISEDFAVMRMSLLPSLLQNVSFNLRHGNDTGETFEISPAQQRVDGKYTESLKMGFVVWGDVNSIWGKSAPSVYRLKSYIENLLATEFPGDKYAWDTPAVVPPLFHPKQSVSLFFRGKKHGILGALHPQVAKDYKIKSDVAFAEFSFEGLFGDKKIVRYKDIPIYPGVEKDVAFVMTNAIKAEAVKKEIVKAGGDMLKDVRIVDRYEGAPLKDNERSISFRLYFQKSDRTLSDEEVGLVFSKIIDAAQQKLPIILR